MSDVLGTNLEYLGDLVCIGSNRSNFGFVNNNFNAWRREANFDLRTRWSKQINNLKVKMMINEIKSRYYR